MRACLLGWFAAVVAAVRVAGVQLTTHFLAFATAVDLAATVAHIVLELLLFRLGGQQFLVDLPVQIEDNRCACDAVQHASQYGLDDALLKYTRHTKKRIMFV